MTEVQLDYNYCVYNKYYFHDKDTLCWGSDVVVEILPRLITFPLVL